MDSRHRGCRVHVETQGIARGDARGPAGERGVLALDRARKRGFRAGRDRVGHGGRIVRVGVLPNINHDGAGLVGQHRGAADGARERNFQVSFDPGRDGAPAAVNRDPERRDAQIARQVPNGQRSRHGIGIGQVERAEADGGSRADAQDLADGGGIERGERGAPVAAQNARQCRRSAAATPHQQCSRRVGNGPVRDLREVGQGQVVVHLGIRDHGTGSLEIERDVGLARRVAVGGVLKRRRGRIVAILERRRVDLHSPLRCGPAGERAQGQEVSLSRSCGNRAVRA